MESGSWAIAALVAYLAGSIPFALLIGFAKGVDLRLHGSRNVGATNCGRIIGRRYGVLCFLLDTLKGLLPALGAGWWFGLLGHEDIQTREALLWLTVAVAALAGHVFPVWLKFRGGKGVATGFGAMLGLWPFLTLPALASMITWAMLAAMFRYASVASITSTALLPLYFWVAAVLQGWSLDHTWPFMLLTTVMALLITIRHWSNLKRLRAGTEVRLGEGSG